MTSHDFTILCVDDEESVLTFLKVALHSYGYRCDTAQNGLAALARIARDPQYFRLVITDIRMPGMDGFGLIERSREAGYSGPFMIYSGSIFSDEQQQLRELKIDSVIAKPGRRGELLAALKKINRDA